MSHWTHTKWDIWKLYTCVKWCNTTLYAEKFEFVLFVWFDSLCSSQHSFSHVGTNLPGLNQYQAEDIVSWSRKQHSVPDEARTCNPSSQVLYHWATTPHSNVLCNKNRQSLLLPLLLNGKDREFIVLRQERKFPQWYVVFHYTFISAGILNAATM